MSKPIQSGDSLTIVHVGGREQRVLFRGVFGNKFDQVYIEWPLAGQYKVQLQTGQLLPKKVSLWRITDDDLERVRDAARDERCTFEEKMKTQRFGTRKKTRR